MEAEKLYFIYVDVALTVLILLLFGEECHFVVKTYRHFNITIKSIWLISIYPVFAVSALLTVLVPRAAYICDFVSTIYLSVCLFQFSSLLLQYFGHVNHLLSKVKDTGYSLRARPCCCCCVCCPLLPATRKSLITVRMMIFQTAVLQPVIQFIAAILWADDKYYRSGLDFTQSYIYLTVLKLVSTITAIYGLNSLHGSMQAHLRTHNTRPKLMALQFVQIFFNIQGIIITIPSKFNVPPCKDGFSSHYQMLEWHHLVLVVEMFLLSLLARIFYRRPLNMDAILEAQSGTLADIYLQNIPDKQTDTDSNCSKVLSKLATCPQHQTADQAPQNNGDSLCVASQSQEDSLCVASLSQRQSMIQLQPPPTPTTYSEPGEVHPKDHNKESDKFHLISENNLREATGTLNQTFDTETPRTETAEHCSNKEKSSTTETSGELTPGGGIQQNPEPCETSDNNTSGLGHVDAEGQQVAPNNTERLREETSQRATEIIIIRL